MAQTEIKIKLNADIADAVSKFSQLNKVISDLTKHLQDLTKSAGIPIEKIGKIAPIAPEKIKITPKKEEYEAVSSVEYAKMSPTGEVVKETLPISLKTTIPTAQATAEQELRRKEKLYELEKRLYQAGYQNSTIQSKIKELTKAQGTDFDVLLSKTKSLASEFEKNKRLNQELSILQARYPQIFEAQKNSKKEINNLTLREKQQLIENVRVEIAHNKALEKREAHTKGLGFGLIRLGSVMKQIGAIGTAAISALMRETIKFNFQLYKLTVGLNIPMQELGKLAFIAESTGISIEQLTKGMGNYYQALLTAGQGTSLVSARVREVFQAVGIAPKKLGEIETKTTFEQLEEIRKVYQGLTQSQDKAYLGQKVFGGAYEDFIPLLNMTNEQFNAMGRIFDKLFPDFASDTDDMLKRIVDLNSVITTWRWSLRVLGGELLKSLQPALESVATVLVNLVERFNELSPSMQKNIANFVLFAPIVLLVGGYITQLYGNIKTLVSHLHWLKTGLLTIISNPILIALSAIAFAFGKIAIQSYNSARSMNDAVNVANRTQKAYDNASASLKRYSDVLDSIGKKSYYEIRIQMLQTRYLELQSEIMKLQARDWDTLVQNFGRIGAVANKITGKGADWKVEQLTPQLKDVERQLNKAYSEIEKIGKGKTGVGLTIPPEEGTKIAKELDLTKQIADAIKQIKNDAKLYNLTITEQIDRYNELLKKYKDNEQILIEINNLEEKRKDIFQRVDDFISEITYKESQLPDDYQKINDLLDKRVKILKELGIEGSKKGKERQIALEEKFNEKILGITIDYLDKQKYETLKSEKELILAKEILNEEDLSRVKELNNLIYQYNLEQLNKSHEALLNFINEKLAKEVNNEQLINELKLSSDESYNQEKLKLENDLQKQTNELKERAEADNNKIIEKYEKEYLTNRLEGLRKNAKYQEQAYESELKIYADFIKELNKGTLGSIQLTEKQKIDLLQKTKQKTYDIINSQVNETIDEYKREGKSVNLYYNEIFDNLIKKFPELQDEINEVRNYFYKTELLPKSKTDEFIINWNNMLKELREGTANAFFNMGNITADFFETFASSFAEAFDKAIFDGENFFDTFNNLLYDFTRSVIKKIMEMLVWLSVTKLFSFFGINFSIPAPTPLSFKEGGLLPSFQGGGIPIMAHPGELIVPKWKTDELISSLNTGTTLGAPVNVNLNISAIDTRTGVEFLLQNRGVIASAIQTSLKENHPLRRR